VFGIGLTGGIGSGKTSVTDRLSARGAQLVDADLIVHEVQRPDGPAFQPIVERFGEAVRAEDGTLDRAALAKLVFNDPKALGELNGIVWPLVGDRMDERREELVSTDDVVVFSIPLLRTEHVERLKLDAIVVVDCPIEVAVERLVSARGMDRADAEARVRNQIGREQRLALADFVVDNSSTVEHLDQEVARLWDWIEDRRASGP
jgi:dephospho-CoA kinase